MSSIINTRSYFQAQTKLVKKVYSNSNPKKPLRYPMVFNQYKGDYDRAFFQYLSLVGFGTLAQRDEGTVPVVDASKEGLMSLFAYTSYALRYIVTKEMIREDAKSIIPKLPGLLKYSSDQTKEYLFWNILNFAFNPLVTLADGQPLISSAHPLVGTSAQPGVTTYSNNLGAVPLTVETLEQAFILMGNMVDDRGLLTFRTPKNLVYPLGLHQAAQEVLASSHYPHSDENRINSVAGSLDPMPIEYLTAGVNGPFPWFVMADKGEAGEDSHSLFYDIKWDEQDAFYVEETKSMVHETEFRAVYGAVDGRGIVGSSGG